MTIIRCKYCPTIFGAGNILLAERTFRLLRTFHSRMEPIALWCSSQNCRQFGTEQQLNWNPFGQPLFRYAALGHPEHAESISRVLAIPAKRHDRKLSAKGPLISYR